MAQGGVVDQLSVRERPLFPRHVISAANIPRDKFISREDDLHLKLLHAPGLPAVLLRVRQHFAPKTIPLLRRVNSEKSKVPYRVAALRDLTAAHDGAACVPGNEDGSVGRGDLGDDSGDINALTRQEVALCRPRLGALLAAVGRLDDGAELGSVARGCDFEFEVAGHFVLVGAGRRGAAAISAVSPGWAVRGLNGGTEITEMAGFYDEEWRARMIQKTGCYTLEKSRSNVGNDGKRQIHVSGVKTCGAEASIQSEPAES